MMSRSNALSLLALALGVALSACGGKSGGNSGGSSGGTAGTDVQVRGYRRKDGTYVKPHTRARPGSRKH